MQCHDCGSTHIRKNGYRRGKQNHRCVACNRQFIEHHTLSGYSDEVKQLCLRMYVNGMGFRGIEQVTGVHHITSSLGLNKSENGFQMPMTQKQFPPPGNSMNEKPLWGDQIISKTYMTRVEGENTRLRHYLARLHRKILCYSKSREMLKHKGSIATSLSQI